MNNNLLHIEADNISVAWTKAFMAVMQRGYKPSTMIVTISVNDSPPEIEAIRNYLNDKLISLNESSVDTVAKTIFPYSMWNKERPGSELFGRYLAIEPRIRSCPPNRKGTYFQRLIAYRETDNRSFNQLEHVIETYRRGNHRRSALQAVIFNPLIDHTHQHQRGFPCLQQVFFTPDSSGELVITGVYATQNVFEKAYGNYKGLYHLGVFMAQEMGLVLKCVTCFANVAKLGNVNKSDVNDLAFSLSSLI